MRIITQPRVYLVGRTSTEPSEIDRFLKENEVSWTTDTSVGGEQLCEMAGRTCYMSFGKGRKTNADYLGHIIGVGHGSVLEHATWNFLITGVSRSFTHELIRHRAGFGYSQLSQRYVDESDCDFVEPDCIAQDEKLHAIFLQAVRQSHEAYVALVEGEVEFDEGTVDVPIGRDTKHREKKTVAFDKSAKEAFTRYKVLQRHNDVTLVALFPKTGRTHQLRVHMRYIKHPILGDSKYGKKNSFSRLALHAKSIGFKHPMTKEYVEFSSKVPDEFLTKVYGKENR